MKPPDSAVFCVPGCRAACEHEMDGERHFYEEENYEGICVVSVPKVEYWPGSNRSWERIAAYGPGCFRIKD